MIRPGLVSITFRQLSPAEIVDLAARSGLEAVEWGGDVHVPHGDLAAARRAAAITRAAGLAVAAYGSYYRVAEEDQPPFETILETAVELGADLIRVWAGSRGSADADDAFRGRVAGETRRIADLAAAENIRIVYEWHGGTLTDTTESGVALLRAVGHGNVGTYWQPPGGMTIEQCLGAVDAVAQWLGGLHVFAWHRETGERLPMSDGRDRWPKYLARAAATAKRDMYALLEFVPDNDPAVLPRDAATLRRWLGAAGAADRSRPA